MEQAKIINVQLIDRPNPPVRGIFNEDEISSLAESIRTNGILVPLLVRQNGERFEVIDGDCRLEAAYRNRLTEVPCMVRSASDSETHILRMLANLDRNDPDPVSEAIYIAKAIKSGSITAEELAEKLGRGAKWIDDRLAIAAMPEYMQDAIREKRLPLGVALALFEVDDDTVRRRWVNFAIRDGMTVRAAEDALREYERLKDLGSSGDEQSSPPPMPEAPPRVLHPCARCGEHADASELRFVRVHLQECPEPLPSHRG